MRIDFEATTLEDWRLGIGFYVAEDSYGMHRCFEIGLLLFVIRFNMYE